MLDNKKLIGLLAFAAAVGMLIMLFLRGQLVGLIMIGLLVLVGYCCLCE